jgi:hypothetical protein
MNGRLPLVVSTAALAVAVLGRRRSERRRETSTLGSRRPSKTELTAGSTSPA